MMKIPVFRSPKLLASANGKPCIETWVPIADFEGLYEVSDLGRVRTLRSGQIMAFVMGGRGPYAQVHLYRNGKRTVRYVHHVVLVAFVGPKPGTGYEACHGERGNLDNTPGNLRWDTKAANIADIVRAGSQRGELNPGSKLTERLILQLRARRRAGESVLSLANAYGISKDYIYRICAGKSWAHVL